jgi:hypothetical protein
MNIEEIRMQLESYAGLAKTLDKIQNQGFYNLFFTSFQSLHSQNKSFKTQEFKKCLKVIVNELIDHIWDFPENIDQSPPISSHRNNSITPTKALKKSVNSCANLKNVSKVQVSTTFSKQKREIQKEIPVTPGPGDYDTSHPKNRSRSPSTVFNKEKRVLELAHKESPGPSAYSPYDFVKSKYTLSHKENI